MDHDFGSVRPNNNDDLKKPSGPIGSQVQGLVRILTIVSCIESVRHGVADVVIIEPVAGLMLPCLKERSPPRLSRHETTEPTFRNRFEQVNRDAGPPRRRLWGATRSPEQNRAVTRTTTRGRCWARTSDPSL